MARRNALINRLGSVETLGATNVIFTDKTGTLTENKMALVSLVIDSNEIESAGSDNIDFTIDGQVIEVEKNQLLCEALKIGVLCNNASLSEKQSGNGEDGLGDPMSCRRC